MNIIWENNEMVSERAGSGGKMKVEKVSNKNLTLGNMWLKQSELIGRFVFLLLF